MRRWCVIYPVMVILVIGVFALVNMGLQQDVMATGKARNVIVNRVAYEVQTSYVETSELQLQPSIDVHNIIDSLLRDHYYDKTDVIKEEYKHYELPIDICFVSIYDATIDDRLAEANDKRIMPIKDEHGDIIGFLVFLFDISVHRNMIIYVNAWMAVCAVILFAFVFYVQVKVLGPFTKMSTYPERLSKGEITDKLPESKNRYFGKFVWGINMLSDKLSGDKKRINKLVQERQVMLTTIAHGIKTPVANIKLYASAIETGLYREDGIPDPKDAEIAAKIDKNADDITVLVKEMIETTATGMVDFQPNPGKFYVTELGTFIEQEYANRLKMLHIPYTVDIRTEAMIDTDKAGIIRILSQILDNAIKYGDGTGITVTVEKQEEGFFFSVKNKGKLLSERELPYIFNSFWRGANAESVEGSGIGMFEAKRIARILGGDVYAKRYEESGEMEFVVYIP